MTGATRIRTEEPADQPRVYEIERAAFDSDVQPRLVEVLRRDAHPQLSLVAEVDDALVGHVFFSPVRFEAESAPPAAQLSPVAVDPACQGRGIGSALIREGLARCPAEGWEAVFLVGNPLFYSRFGLRMAAEFGLSCTGPHAPFLQALELREGCLAGMRGRVDFHPAFDEIEDA